MMRRKNRRSRKLISGLLIFAVLTVGLYVFAIAGSSGVALTSEPNALDRLRLWASGLTSTTSTVSAVPPAGFPAFTNAVSVAELTDTQYLKLVNRTHAIAVPVCETRLRTIWPDIPARTSYETLHETALSAMRDLFAAAEGAGIGGLFIASGYRTRDTQSYLYTNAVDRAYVMPPGHSEHQLGLAADILSGDHTDGMRGSEEARWLAEHAPRFGLTLRYPAHKQEITGVPYEPWHFRYVGRVHAWFMAQHDFVLEEYIEYLRIQGGYQTEFDGKTYYVLYQRPESGMILVPEQLRFRVSSTNTGGYIVTAWR